MEASGPSARSGDGELQPHCLERLEGVPDAADFPLAQAAFPLHLAQGVGQVVQAGDGAPEGAFDKLDLVERLFERGLLVGSRDFVVGGNPVGAAVLVGGVLHG